MTYSNGAFNPVPWANPFNTRLGPSNYSLNPANAGYGRHSFNPHSTQLPDPTPYNSMSQKDLHVPDTAPPMTMGQMLMAIDQHYSQSKTWNDAEIMQFSPSGQGLSKRDAEYWKHSEEESKKMEASMTPEQKKMLDDAMKMFPQSRLEDVEEGEE